MFKKEETPAYRKQKHAIKTAGTVKTSWCTCASVCVCIPTVRLRPAAERGSANIQTLSSLHCTTAAAAAAGLLSYMRARHTTAPPYLTHTHTAKDNQLWGSCIPHRQSLSMTTLQISLPLFLPYPLIHTHRTVQRCSLSIGWSSEI